MRNKFKDLTILGILAVILNFLVWLPHLLSLPNFWGLDFSAGFNTIYRNFDGLEYVAIAKSFYNPDILGQIPLSLPSSYYASHFPGYAVFINAFAPILGYLKSMLLTSLIATILAVWAFYLLLKDFKLTEKPLLLSIIFLILPARWLIVHSVGSSEPLFIFFAILSIYFFMKFEHAGKAVNILLAGFFGILAQITRPPGILLFIAFSLYLLWKYRLSVSKIIARIIPLSLIPFGILGIFFLFSQTLGDFWAYFHSGDNIHLTFPPFQVFNQNQFWVGDIWLEDIIYIFIIGFLGGILLLKQKLYIPAFFVITYLAAGALIAHRDISRYLLPVFPFVLIAFERILTSREFKIILPIIAVAIYLYAQNFILGNTAPVANPVLFN